MKPFRILKVIFLGVLITWAGETIFLYLWNVTNPNRIKSREATIRNEYEVTHKQQMRELEQEYESKKYLATGTTVFDRIFNTENQTISDLIKRISDEALPDGWSCDVKAEEFTHFILLIYSPHNSAQPSLDRIIKVIQPILRYCSSFLSDIAVFDRSHKSFLFFDKTLIAALKSGAPLPEEFIEQATKHGVSFTRFNSVTIECEKYQSHFVIPIEVQGSKGGVICRALFDTGASTTMLPSDVAASTGVDNIKDAPRRSFSTVNGSVTCPIVMREVNIGGIRRNIEVAVNQKDELLLLGMNYFEGLNYIVDSTKAAIHIWEK